MTNQHRINDTGIGTAKAHSCVTQLPRKIEPSRNLPDLLIRTLKPLKIINMISLKL